MTIIILMLIAGTMAFQIDQAPPKKFDCFRDPACHQHRPKYKPRKIKPIDPRVRRGDAGDKK